MIAACVLLINSHENKKVLLWNRIKFNTYFPIESIIAQKKEEKKRINATYARNDSVNR